jgi:hypothetical protein
MTLTTEQRRKIGLSNRRKGLAFEHKVRADLEKSGYIVSKWQNNIKFEEFSTPDNKYGGVGIHGKLCPAHPGHFRLMQTGFPDFVAFIKIENITTNGQILYNVIGVECKSNGYVDKEEREKCKWYLEHKIFSKILIASKGEKRGEIVYKEFEE